MNIQLFKRAHAEGGEHDNEAIYLTLISTYLTNVLQSSPVVRLVIEHDVKVPPNRTPYNRWRSTDLRDHSTLPNVFTHMHERLDMWELRGKGF